MNAMNPFLLNRYEYEDKHLYFLLPEFMSILEGQKPVYLIGTRGTGKTTLLNALSYEERLTNDSLNTALDHEPFKKRFIGIYLKIVKELTSYFDELPESQEFKNDVFSIYLDLIVLRDLVKAINRLQVSKPKYNKAQFKYSSRDEETLARQILDSIPSLKYWCHGIQIAGLDGLYNLFSLMVETISRTVKHKLMVHELAEKLPAMQIGEVGRRITAILGKFCDKHSVKEGRWYFKVCIDEAEWLTKSQQELLNTQVRLSEWPFFLVISYQRIWDRVSDVTSTFGSRVTVSGDDRSLLNLDEERQRIEHKIFEGVAKVRIKEQLCGKASAYDLNKILGVLSINQLLEKVINESKKPKAAEWIDKATKLKATLFWSYKCGEQGNDTIDSGETGELPIHEAYQIEKLGLDHLLRMTPDDSTWVSRKTNREQIRARMVAAYLCICKELGRREVPYAFAIMVRQMSDSIVRDFLKQMSAIYEEVNLPLEKFLVTQLPVEAQTRALVKAAENKRDDISTCRVKNPEHVEKLVEGLGLLTESLQSDFNNKTALSSFERGRFVISFTPGDPMQDTIRKYINDGIDHGYFYLIEDREKSMKFRIHSSLAAYYKTSYRGAYNDIILKCTDIEEMINASDLTSVKQVAHKIWCRITIGKGRNQSLLFDNDERENEV